MKWCCPVWHIHPSPVIPTSYYRLNLRPQTATATLNAVFISASACITLLSLHLLLCLDHFSILSFSNVTCVLTGAAYFFFPFLFAAWRIMAALQVVSAAKVQAQWLLMCRWGLWSLQSLRGRTRVCACFCLTVVLCCSDFSVFLFFFFKATMKHPCTAAFLFLLTIRWKINK